MSEFNELITVPIKVRPTNTNSLLLPRITEINCKLFGLQMTNYRKYAINFFYYK